MTFDDLLDRLWFFDAEVFAHDSLFVFIKYRTEEEYVAHNCSANELQNFIDKNNPILCGYNSNGYDKWILKFWLAGGTPEELKKILMEGTAKAQEEAKKTLKKVLQLTKPTELMQKAMFAM